ncbi:MAG: PEP-utilizing enzyme, partial [Actinomycetes bacterium]
MPYVIVARDLAPSDVAVLPHGSVAALLLEEGGPTSHTVILARAMGVPAVVGCAGALRVPEGAVVLVDGDTGQVRVAPTAAELARTTGRRAA